MKLLIATPAFDPRVCVETYLSMVSLDTCGLEVEAYAPTGYGVVEARTRTAEKALESNADWLLCVDSDMVVPKDALRNLMSHGVDVCFGYCQSGSGENGMTTLCELGRSNYDSKLSKDELHEMRDDGTYLVEIRGAGFGIVLIKADVFRRIQEPWFQYTWSSKGRKLSEDYYFCTQCRNAGIKVYADTRVDCGHVKQVVK